MKRPVEVVLVYATGLLQGLALVTVPAASSVLTDPDLFAFTESEYGMLFVPQVIMAVLGALLGPKLARKRGLKPVFQAGLVFNLCAMGLIAASQMFQDQHAPAYGAFLLGTTAVGAGFGLTLPMINVYAERLFLLITSSTKSARFLPAFSGPGGCRRRSPVPGSHPWSIAPLFLPAPVSFHLPS